MLSIVLAVRDSEVSQTFYTDVLGFGTNGPGLKGPNGKVAFADAIIGGTQVMLDSTEPVIGVVGHGVILYVNVESDFDIDTFYADVQRKGATVKDAIADKFWGERMFSISDPDGYTIAFGKKVFDATNEDMERAMQGGAGS